MERKLLSLPSFFVLLLVAGIAFLAAPVVDVHATPPGAVTAEIIDPAGTAAVPSSEANALTASGMTDVLVLKIADTAVKVTTAAGVTPVVAAGVGFGVEDLRVTVTNTLADPDEEGPLGASKIRLTPIKGTDTLPGGITGSIANDNQWFIVGVEIPENGIGNIEVEVLPAHATLGSAFQESGAGTDAYAGNAAAPTTNNVVHYNTHNPLPTVTIKPLMAADDADSVDARTSAGLTAFPVRFTITDPESDPASKQKRGFSPTPTFTAASIDIAGGSVTDVDAVASGSDANTYTVTAYVQVSTSTTPIPTSVIIGVKPGVVTDKDGGMNVAIPTTKSGTPPALVNDAAKEVTIDTVRPQAKVEVPDGDHAIGVGFTATFTFTETTGAGASAVTTTLNRSVLGDDGLEANEITVAGGALTNLAAKPGSFKAYTATITPAANAATVKITVAANAVTDAAGNGSMEGSSREIKTGFTPGVVTEGTGERRELSGTRRGFGFTLPAMPAPTATDGSDRFVVLAKSGTTNAAGVTVPASADNGLTVPASRFVDIDDGLWQDLADFLAYDGGTINLIGPAGTAENTLVISEIMWGGDAYLSADPAKSQWIELYNATTTKGTATGAIASGIWEIEFHAGTGLVSDPANLSDNFSNRELGNAHWDIPNVSGGKYGQSGRTQTTPGVAGSLRDLVSMRRKIDYAKVEKTDHKDSATENRAEQVKGIPDGALPGSWEASTSRVNMSGTRKGTPGARHVVVVGTTGISKSVVFNEIANRSDKKFDWIELYNPGSADVKINNWVLSKVTKVDTDDKLFKFESDENIVVPAKGFLLVVNEDPSETALAAGENVDNPNSNANGLPTKIYINSGLDIPKEKFLLILRTEEKLKSHEKIVDIGGHLGDLDLSHVGSATELWPLKAWKRIKNDDLGENNDKTWVRDKGKDLYHGDAWKSDGGVTGLGIDRNPDSSDGPTSGTPGFDNGAVKDKVKDLTASDPVVISEIMFGTGNNRVPQWIELFNPSKTQAVKLHNWRLEVQNTISASEKLNVEFNYTLILPDVRIQPNQTVLIVSSSTGDATRDRFPKDRIINIWSTRALRDITEMSSPRDAILSSVGFYMKLSDPEKQVVDQLGNIDGNRRSADDPAWTLPGGNLDEGGRASMIRREGTFGNGTEKDAWISAAATDGARKVGINELYYGDESDVGTPGYRAGGPLPVQLSSFYSKRNDAGAVIITWSTESELDNAGFNILRSLSRAGEFTRINAQLIPGAGTTGEKNTYTWTDTSARPNVVYYYQIEDVSLDGDHRTLRTTRLRGYVGAAGKATTIWGELKSRD